MPKRKLDEFESKETQTQNNQITDAFEILKKNKPQTRIERLLERLENLKTDKTSLNVNLGHIATEDEPEIADDIRKKITELMETNHTIQSLSLNFSYMHKRISRELVVYTENGVINIKLINGDNYFNHGEFSVPGFSEVDEAYDEVTDEPVFSKVVEVFDRSNVIKFAFLKQHQLSFFKNSSYEEGLEKVICDYIEFK